MIRAIAIDDEPIALEIIASLASKVPFLILEASYVNAFDALKFLHDHPVDLLFLDIKMPDISGIEFLQSLTDKPLVIFTTAYTEHAVKSYELDAVDYLLKPFSSGRFLKACNRARELMALRTPVMPAKPEFLFLKSGYEQVKVFFSEILYIESSGNYMVFVLQNGKLLPRLTIQETLQLLPAQDFLRVHRSFIIARDKVTKIERHQLHLGPHVIPIGNAFSDKVEGFF
jgi:two-component system LytT family response regulator